MRIPFIAALLLLLCCCSCGDTREAAGEASAHGERYSGIYLSNSQRYGRFYKDPEGKVYVYRYIETIIRNDTSVPLWVHTAFPRLYHEPAGAPGKPFRAFLLPQNLSAGKQHADDVYFAEVKPYLDKALDEPLNLDRRLQPGEACVLQTGLLVDTIYRIDPYPALFSNGHRFHIFPWPDKLIGIPDSVMKQATAGRAALTLALGVDFGLSVPDSSRCYAVIPMGRISFH